MNKNLCFILVLAIVSISLCEVAPFMGQNGNTIVGMSASGLPIFQAPTGDVLYPIPSLENPNVAEWVPIFDFITKSSIVDIYENGIPVFQLPNGDLVQFDIKQRSSTKFKDFESIVSPHKQQLPAQNVPPPPLDRYYSEKKDSPQKKDSERKPGGKKAKIPSNKPQTNIADEFQQKLMDKLQQNENEVSLQLPGGTLISETCYVPATRSSCAPHFIISGAMKSGTTSLFSYLLNHPRILPLVDSPKLNGAPVIADKEVRFFTDPTFSSMVSSLGAQSALNAYLEVFPEISPSSGMITGESSPMYICQKGVATRVKEFLPHVKNIILLRDPVDRIYSEHWFKLDLVRNNLPIKTQLDLFEQCTKQEMNLLRYCNTITGSLEDAECYFNTLRKVRRLSADNELCLPGGLYDGLCPENEQMSYNTCNLLGVKNSIYVLQLKEWLDAFDSSQLLILPSETFYSNPVETLQNVTDYLGVGDEYFDWTFIKDKAYNIKSDSALPSKLVMSEGDTTSLTEKYPPLNPHLRKELQDFFAPFNKQLAELLNIPNFWDY